MSTPVVQLLTVTTQTQVLSPMNGAYTPQNLPQEPTANLRDEFGEAAFSPGAEAQEWERLNTSNTGPLQTEICTVPGDQDYYDLYPHTRQAYVGNSKQLPHILTLKICSASA